MGVLTPARPPLLAILLVLTQKSSVIESFTVKNKVNMIGWGLCPPHPSFLSILLVLTHKNSVFAFPPPKTPIPNRVVGVG